jgi:uracil phosphoribosyltransferase
MAEMVRISRHPLVQSKLTRLRDKSTGPKEFRELVADLARLLFVDASADLALTPATVETPLAPASGHVVSERVGLFPILRAGLGMAHAIVDLLPEAQVWHLGLYRDHESLEPVEYYNKLPEYLNIDRALVLDPMLATGGSASVVVEILKRRRVPRIQFIALIAAPEGMRRMQQAFPDVPIFLAGLDSHLNEIGYIVPGLGDAGDRQFGTGTPSAE